MDGNYYHFHNAAHYALGEVWLSECLVVSLKFSRQISNAISSTLLNCSTSKNIYWLFILLSSSLKSEYTFGVFFTCSFFFILSLTKIKAKYKSSAGSGTLTNVNEFSNTKALKILFVFFV